MTGYVAPVVRTSSEIECAIRSSLTVTLTHRDGRRLVGVPHEHPTETEYFVLVRGGKSLPREIHFDDVLEVSFE